MKMLVVGDTHGDKKFSVEMVLLAESLGITRIHQVGDFGIWPGYGGVMFLDALQEACADSHVFWTFTDGNHEDFDQLEWFREQGKDDNGFVIIRPNIRWADRGTIWEEGGRTIMSMGGAASIDKQARRSGESWWWQELITDEQVDYAIGNAKGRKVDIMFTHDTIGGVDIGPLIPHMESDINRRQMSRVVAAVKPDIMIHGHFHRWLNYSHRNTRIWGLDANVGNWGRAHVILDTETMKVTMRAGGEYI